MSSIDNYFGMVDYIFEDIEEVEVEEKIKKRVNTDIRKSKESFRKLMAESGMSATKIANEITDRLSQDPECEKPSITYQAVSQFANIKNPKHAKKFPSGNILLILADMFHVKAEEIAIGKYTEETIVRKEIVKRAFEGTIEKAREDEMVQRYMEYGKILQNIMKETGKKEEEIPTPTYVR